MYNNKFRCIILSWCFLFKAKKRKHGNCADLNTCSTCKMKIWISVLRFSGSTPALRYILSQQVKWDNSALKKYTLVHFQQLLHSPYEHLKWRICESHISPALKIVRIITVDPGTWYYPPVRLRCLYISNLGDQAAGQQSWSTQWLPINGLRSIGRAHPEQRFPCGCGLWHRGTCPQPSALIWQMILYQRPLHWFGW